MTYTPSEVRQFFDALTEAEKLETGLVVSDRKNTSWKSIVPIVKQYAIEQKSFSLAELKDAGIIPRNTTGQTFTRCVLKALLDDGLVLHEQKGVLKRNASLYHLDGHAMEINFDDNSKFEEPSEKAATYIVKVLLNGSVGRVNILDRMTVKQFPFMKSKYSMKQFEPILRDEAGKEGWKFGSRPYIGIKEE